MKTFLRKNRLRLFLLGVPIICLIVLWNVNIYKPWYDRTLWKNLGSPPSRSLHVRYVRFPGTYVHTPGAYFPTYFGEPEPTVDVETLDGRVYSSDLEGQWSQAEYAYAPVYPTGKVHKWDCAKRIEKEWGLKEEEFPHATNVFVQGKCSQGSSYQYAIYQIRENGDIWGKYINGEDPEYFLLNFTYYTFLVIVALYVFTSPVRYENAKRLELKPDFEAK